MPVPLRPTSWVEVTLPELIWIACLHKETGLSLGTDLALQLSAAALKVAPDYPKWFATASDYSLGGIETEEGERRQAARSP